jgi:hypothetical protein
LSNDFDGKVEAFTIFKEIQNLLTAAVAIVVGLNFSLEVILWSILGISIVCYPLTFRYISKKEQKENKQSHGTTLLTTGKDDDADKFEHK